MLSCREVKGYSALVRSLIWFNSDLKDQQLVLALSGHASSAQRLQELREALPQQGRGSVVTSGKLMLIPLPKFSSEMSATPHKALAQQELMTSTAWLALTARRLATTKQHQNARTRLRLSNGESWQQGRPLDKVLSNVRGTAQVQTIRRASNDSAATLS